MGYTFDTSISVTLKYITFFHILHFNFNIYAVISFGYFSAPVVYFLVFFFTEADQGSLNTSGMEIFPTVVNCFQPVNIVAKI